jgi:K+-sensing histidine kinase KdpD
MKTKLKILEKIILSLRYKVVSGGLLFLIAISVYAGPLWLGFKTGMWVWAVILMGILATFASAIFDGIRRKADEVLLAEQIRYQLALKDFASTLIFIRDTEELSKKVISQIMLSVNLSFCAMYLKQDDVLCLSYCETHGQLNVPKEIHASLELMSSTVLKKGDTQINPEGIPQIKNLPVGMVYPLFVESHFFGVIILGRKENGFFTGGDKDAFITLANQTSLSLSEIYYFEEYQKATEDKYKLLLERERLQSAFQISEAYRHELGNVINIISLAMSNLIYDEYYQPTRQDIDQSVASIRNSVKRAQNIFNSISRYNEHAKSEFKKFDLSIIVKNQIDLQKDVIIQKKIHLKADLPLDMIVSANANLSDAIRYVLEGAIRAIDYYSPPEREITVKIFKDGKSVCLKIADTGKDVTNNMIYAGVGIERGKEGGLNYFIARRIVFDHKGGFKVVSLDEGKGSVFIIDIPLV